jgi:hypothetical protein
MGRQAIKPSSDAVFSMNRGPHGHELPQQSGRESEYPSCIMSGMTTGAAVRTHPTGRRGARADPRQNEEALGPHRQSLDRLPNGPVREWKLLWQEYGVAMKVIRPERRALMYLVAGRRSLSLFSAPGQRSALE